MDFARLILRIKGDTKEEEINVDSDFISITVWIRSVVEKDVLKDELFQIYPLFITSQELVWLFQSYLHWKASLSPDCDITVFHQKIGELMIYWISCNYQKEWNQVAEGQKEESELLFHSAFSLAKLLDNLLLINQLNELFSLLSAEVSPEQVEENEEDFQFMDPLTILDIPTDELATYFSSKIYYFLNKLKFRDFLPQMGEDRHPPPNLRALFSEFNSITSTFTNIILQGPNRECIAEILSKCIELGYFLLEEAPFTDYNTAVPIIQTFYGAIIYRMKRAKVLLLDNTIQKLEHCHVASDIRRGMRKLYTEHENTKENYFPFIGALYQDIIYIMDGNTVLVKDGNVNLRMVCSMKISLEPWKLFHDQEIESKLLAMPTSRRVDVWFRYQKLLFQDSDEDNCYQLSLKREPRGGIPAIQENEEGLNELYGQVLAQIEGDSSTVKIIDCIFSHKLPLEEAKAKMKKMNKKKRDKRINIVGEILQSIWREYCSFHTPSESMRFRVEVLLSVESRIRYCTRSKHSTFNQLLPFQTSVLKRSSAKSARK